MGCSGRVRRAMVFRVRVLQKKQFVSGKLICLVMGDDIEIHRQLWLLSSSLLLAWPWSGGNITVIFA